MSSMACLYTYTLVPSDNLRFPHGSLLRFPPPPLLYSCSSFKVQPGATSSVKLSLVVHPLLCAFSLLSICSITSLDCLVRQLTLSLVVFFLTVSFSRAGTLAWWIKGAMQVRATLRQEIAGGIWQWRGSQCGFSRKSKPGSARKMVWCQAVGFAIYRREPWKGMIRAM